jgi:hypothetical protein
MIYRRYLHIIFTSLLILLLLSLSTCEKFTGDQTVPAYLKINGICLNTQQSQGSSSSIITDAWVYVDDEFIGAFEMPAKFPVLKMGKQNITIYAGIKKNGIATTRAAYPFYSGLDLNLRLTPDSTTTINTTCTTYDPSTSFLWMENFESAGLSLDTTPRSQVALTKTLSDSPLTFEGMHSGAIRMDTSKNRLEIVTHSSYTIPNAPVYLELNFNTTCSITVGVVIYVNYSIVQTPVISLNPTEDKWKKIYIDLTSSLNAYQGANGFKVYFGATLPTGTFSSQTLLDNIKLVTRQ